MLVYTRDISKCYILGDLIFALVVLKKASNSQPIASFFRSNQREKQ
jgi:hypothetical protein